MNGSTHNTTAHGVSCMAETSLRAGKIFPSCSMRQQQRGMNLFSLLFWVAFFGTLVLLGLNVSPTLIEYNSIRRTVDKLAAAQMQSPAEIRAAYDKQAQIDYGIQSVTGKDLAITKRNNGFEVAFAYDKQIPIFGPVSLLIKYEGKAGPR
jgi:hypothetical protein